MSKNKILRIILLSCIYVNKLVYGQSYPCSSNPCPSLHLCVPLDDMSYKCICIDPTCFQKVETTPIGSGGNLIHLFHLNKKNFHHMVYFKIRIQNLLTTVRPVPVPLASDAFHIPPHTIAYVFLNHARTRTQVQQQQQLL